MIACGDEGGSWSEIDAQNVHEYINMREPMELTFDLGEEGEKAVKEIYESLGPFPVFVTTKIADPKIEVSYAWLRTADILPPTDTPVLIVRRKNLDEPLRVEQGTLLPDGRWKSFGHFFQQKNVLFWMPMPEPPKEE